MCKVESFPKKKMERYWTIGEEKLFLYLVQFGGKGGGMGGGGE
jgi:hypothetical protein